MHSTVLCTSWVVLCVSLGSKQIGTKPKREAALGAGAGAGAGARACPRDGGGFLVEERAGARAFSQRCVWATCCGLAAGAPSHLPRQQLFYLLHSYILRVLAYYGTLCLQASCAASMQPPPLSPASANQQQPIARASRPLANLDLASADAALAGSRPSHLHHHQ